MKHLPVIARAALNDTLDVASTFDNRDELIECYTPTNIDEKEEIKKHECWLDHRRITVELERKNQVSAMLQTTQKVPSDVGPKRQKSAEKSHANPKHEQKIQAMINKSV